MSCMHNFGKKGEKNLRISQKQDLMVQERFNPVGEFDYEDWRTEVEDWLTKLGRDESHYDYGKLNKISGDVLSRRVKAQKLYTDILQFDVKIMSCSQKA